MNALLLAGGVSGALAPRVVAAVDPEKVKPGWLGLTVVLILCVVTFLLWRSMNHQLKKVHFEESTGEDTEDERNQTEGDRS
ncbi:MAG: hypothetical protein ACRDOJ_12825 [Nocardioidaceae bacterium]